MNYTNKNKTTITLTFGDVAENHIGMEKIGNILEKGYSLIDLKRMQNYFVENKYDAQIYDLSDLLKDKNKLDNLDNGYILVVKKGLNLLLSDMNKTEIDLFEEQSKLDPDKKALMYGRVVNKIARHNLCFHTFDQKSDYENGKGSIINFNDIKIPITKYVWNMLKEKLDTEQIFVCEGNYYYDTTKCYIGFHGDSERKKVIGIRLGDDFPLLFRWFYKGKQISDTFQIILKSGDIYIMSEKATGNDWKTKGKYTLRHAAGYNIK